MSVIWDWPLQVKPEGEIIMAPRFARWLHIVVKGDIPHLYALVDPNQSLDPYVFRTLCAGQKVITYVYDSKDIELPIVDELHYIDSFSIGDWFVGHVFLQEPGERISVDERFDGDFAQVGFQFK